MIKKIGNLLKELSVLLKMFVFLPFYMISSILIFNRYDISEFTVSFILLTVSSLTSIFFCKHFSKRFEKNYKAISFVVLIVINTLLSVVFYRNIFMIIISVILLSISNLRMIEVIDQGFMMYYSLSEYVWCAVFHLALIASLYLIDNFLVFTCNYNGLVASFFALTLFMAVYLNQSNLELMMTRRKHDINSLPPKVRKQNLIIVCIIVALLGFSLIFAQGIFSLVITLLKWGALLLIYAFVYFTKLLSFLLPFQTAEGPKGSQNVDFGFEDKETTNNSLSMIIIMIIISGVLLFFIIKYGKTIVKNIIKLIKRIFEKVFSIYQREHSGTTQYYFDKVEELSDSENEFLTKKGSTYRKIKKELKQLNKEQDVKTKVRKGYRILMEYFLYRNIPLEPYDTPTEIAEKSTLVLKKEEVLTLTKTYETVRYKEVDPSFNELTEFENKLKNTVWEKQK